MKTRLVTIGSVSAYSEERTDEIAKVLTDAGYQVAYIDRNFYSFNVMKEENEEEEP